MYRSATVIIIAAGEQGSVDHNGSHAVFTEGPFSVSDRTPMLGGIYTIAIQDQQAVLLYQKDLAIIFAFS